MPGLLVDIGGTKTSISWVEPPYTFSSIQASRLYKSKDYASFEELLDSVMHKNQTSIKFLSLGVAGPVQQGRVSMVNLSWTLDAKRLSERYGCPVTIVNDVQAHAQGIALLQPHELEVLYGDQQVENKGPKGVMAIGTGVGQAYLTPDERGSLKAHPSEGGHATFAPCNEVMSGVQKMLTKKYGHVSVERVISGKFGFQNLYEYFLTQGSSPLNSKKIGGEEVVKAWKEHHPTAREILLNFCEAVGSEAGNMALKFLSYGGIYLSGGVLKHLNLPQNPELSEAFLKGYLEKGRYKNILKTIPVFIVKPENTPLRGLLPLKIN